MGALVRGSAGLLLTADRIAERAGVSAWQQQAAVALLDRHPAWVCTRALAAAAREF
jgi:hypothetical protein